MIQNNFRTPSWLALPASWGVKKENRSMQFPYV